MIYLIGGPPKCGKTTLSKRLSKSLGIPWISTDTLQSIIQFHTPAKELAKKFPYVPIKKKLGPTTDKIYEKYSAKQIMKLYKTTAESTAHAIDVVVECEIVNKHNYIIEGHHLLPKFSRKYNK